MEPKSARVSNYWVYLLRSLGFAIWYICKTVMGPKSVKSLELFKITIKHNCYLRVVFSVNLHKYFRKLTYRRKRAVTKFYQISELWKPQTKMLFQQNLIKERRNFICQQTALRRISALRSRWKLEGFILNVENISNVSLIAFFKLVIWYRVGDPHCYSITTWKLLTCRFILLSKFWS